MIKIYANFLLTKRFRVWYNESSGRGGEKQSAAARQNQGGGFRPGCFLVNI